MLRINSLTLTLSGRQILTDISAEINPGDCCIISGKNGSGKSCLVRALLGVEKSSHGEVLLDGRNVALLSNAEHRQYFNSTGIVSQELLPNSNNSVAHVLMSHRPGPEQLEKTVNFLHLKGDRQVASLSASEKRQLDLGRSLVNDPKLIVWDEPFTFLDYAAKQKWLHHLRDKKISGLTIIIATEKPQDCTLLEPEIKIQL